MSVDEDFALGDCYAARCNLRRTYVGRQFYKARWDGTALSGRTWTWFEWIIGCSHARTYTTMRPTGRCCIVHRLRRRRRLLGMSTIIVNISFIRSQQHQQQQRVKVKRLRPNVVVVVVVVIATATTRRPFKSNGRTSPLSGFIIVPTGSGEHRSAQGIALGDQRWTGWPLAC